MSGRTVEGKMGLFGEFRMIPKLCKNPTLTYDENAVEINGKGFSGTIPVSAISAVFIETKSSTSLLIGAGIAMVIGIVCILIAAAVSGGGSGGSGYGGNFYGGGYGSGYGRKSGGGGDAVGAIGSGCMVAGVILLAAYFWMKKAVLRIISDGYAYTLLAIGKGELADDLEKAKDELSKIVVAGRRAVN